MPPGAPPAPKDLGRHNLQRRGSQPVHLASPRRRGRRAPSNRARRPPVLDHDAGHKSPAIPHWIMVLVQGTREYQGGAPPGLATTATRSADDASPNSR